MHIFISFYGISMHHTTLYYTDITFFKVTLSFKSKILLLETKFMFRVRSKSGREKRRLFHLTQASEQDILKMHKPCKVFVSVSYFQVTVFRNLHRDIPAVYYTAIIMYIRAAFALLHAFLIGYVSYILRPGPIGFNYLIDQKLRLIRLPQLLGQGIKRLLNTSYLKYSLTWAFHPLIRLTKSQPVIKTQFRVSRHCLFSVTQYQNCEKDQHDSHHFETGGTYKKPDIYVPSPLYQLR